MEPRVTRPQLRGVHIHPEQIDRAVRIMAALNRGLFVWTEQPPTAKT